MFPMSSMVLAAVADRLARAVVRVAIPVDSTRVLMAGRTSAADDMLKADSWTCWGMLLGSGYSGEAITRCAVRMPAPANVIAALR